MPTYDYLCPKCGHAFEQFQPMSEAPLQRCPRCKKLGLKRLVGAGAGLIFKGTGFYITDYKNKPSPPAGEGGDSKPAGESKTGEAAQPAAEGKPVAAAKPAAPAKSKSAKKR